MASAVAPSAPVVPAAAAEVVPPVSEEPAMDEIIEDRSKAAQGFVKRYRRGKLLGKGGFAKCFEMTSLDSGRTYAGKVVPKSTLQKSSAKKKLLNEIKIHKSLDHVNIVRFERFFEDKNNVYILLEVCPCQTMMELIKQRKRLSEPEVRFYMLQLVHTIRHLHQRQVIHRDLKLGNLFLGETLDIKLGDFGLAAKIEFDGERRKTVCGTPNYIAPEILDGKNGHSFEVDIWSLGVICYTLLIGKPPFETSNVKSTYKKIKANEYSFPSYIQISNEATDLVRSILQLEPENRLTLDAIEAHPFLRGETPRHMPLTALNIQPIFKKTDMHFPIPAPTAKSSLPSVPEHDMVDVDKENVHKQFSERLPQQTAAKSLFDVQKDKSSTLNIPSTFSTMSIAEAMTAVQAPPLQVYRAETRPLSSAPQESAFAPVSHLPTSAFSLPNSYLPATSAPVNAAQMGLTQPVKLPTSEASAFVSVANVETAAAAPPLSARLFGGAMLPSSSAFSVPLTARPLQFNQFELQPSASQAVDSARPVPMDCAPTSSNDDNVALAGTPSALDDEESGSLRGLHIDLERSVARQQDGIATSASNTQAISQVLDVWVSKWVDYSEKYGLGYLLSNGAYGVYFNDSSRIVLSPDSINFEYQDRRTTPGQTPSVQRYTMNDFPQEMHKKATLLKHFRKYLLQHNSKPIVPNSSEGHEAVYVKRWLRTKHAILFRLSNRTVQVNFMDHTEVILATSQDLVTFTDKSGVRTSYALHSVLDQCPSPELYRRIKYTKEILAHMLNKR